MSICSKKERYMENSANYSLKTIRNNFNFTVEDIASSMGIEVLEYKIAEETIQKHTKLFLTGFLHALSELDDEFGDGYDSADFWAYHGFYNEALAKGWSPKIISNDDVYIEYKKDLGQRIKAIREARHLTQEQFAITFESTQKTISHWETGRSEPPISFIANLVEAFPDLDIYELIIGHGATEKRMNAFKEFYIQDVMKKSLVEVHEGRDLIDFYRREEEFFELLVYASEPLLKKFKSALLEMKNISEKF